MKWDKPDTDGVWRLRTVSGENIASVGQNRDGPVWWRVFGFEPRNGAPLVGEAQTVTSAKRAARNAVCLQLDLLGFEERK